MCTPTAHWKDPRFIWEDGRMDREMLSRKRGKGWDERERWRDSAAGSFFPVIIPGRCFRKPPIWWKSNSTLALIMWQLEFAYLVNPSLGFRFQLISLRFLHLPPRGMTMARQYGGEGIQYDGEGGGRGSHMLRPEMAKMPAQHIQILQAKQGDEISPVFLSLKSEQPNIFYSGFLCLLCRAFKVCVWGHVLVLRNCAIFTRTCTECFLWCAHALI